jgi:hypothetical protein
MGVRVFTLALFLMAESTVGASVPAPPPPRPFDDPSIAQRFEAWQKTYDQCVSEAAIKLARARIIIRAEENQGGVTEAEKRASQEFTAARRMSLEQLGELAKLHADVKSSASPGDLQRIEDALRRQREWFTSTEPNTLEVLETITT